MYTKRDLNIMVTAVQLHERTQAKRLVYIYKRELIMCKREPCIFTKEKYVFIQKRLFICKRDPDIYTKET